MSHPLFDPKVTRRSHDLDKFPSPLEELLEWKFATEDPSPSEYRPWEKESCIRYVVKHRSSYNMASQHMLLQAIKPSDEGSMSPQEALFWLSILTAPLFSYDPDIKHTRVAEIKRLYPDQFNEDWVTQHCDAFDVKRFRAQIQTPATLERIFPQDTMNYPTEAITLCLRVFLSYKEVMYLAFTHAQLPIACGFLCSLGPCPKENKDELVLVLREFISKQILTTTDFDHNNPINTYLFSLLQVMPDRQSIINMLSMLHQNKEINMDTMRRIYPYHYVHDDDDVVLDLVMRMRQFGESRAILLYVQRFGLQQPELSRVMVHFASSETWRVESHHWEVLTQIHIPELVAPFYRGIEGPESRQKVDAYINVNHPSRTAGLLVMCEQRGKPRTWALDKLQGRLSLFEKEETQRLEKMLPLCPKNVQTLIKKQLLSQEEVGSRLLPEQAWAPWMKTLALDLEEHTPESILGPLFKNFLFDLLPDIPSAKPQHRFPLGVLLGAIKACQPSTNQTEKEALSAMMDKAPDEFVLNDEIDAFLLHLLNHWRKNVPKQSDSLHLPGLSLITHFGRNLCMLCLADILKELRKTQSPLAIKLLDELNQVEQPHTIWVIHQAQELGIDHNKYPSVKAARHLVTAYKNAHNMQGDAFEDWIMPSFGFDRAGRRAFDYGPRQITMVVHGAADIEFKSSTGKTSRAMPPVKQSDDRTKANSARLQYKAISKPLRAALKAQNQRFEDAMITQKRWKVETWRHQIWHRPLLMHIARRLVWQLFDHQRQHLGFVLADEDGTFTNLQADTITPPDNALIALAHPAEMALDQRKKWLDLLADFEIIQPFPQLLRTVYPKDKEPLRVLRRALKNRHLNLEAFWKEMARDQTWRPRYLHTSTKKWQPDETRRLDVMVLERGISHQSLAIEFSSPFDISSPYGKLRAIYVKHPTYIKEITSIIDEQGNDWTDPAQIPTNSLLFSELIHLLQKCNEKKK